MSFWESLLKKKDNSYKPPHATLLLLGNEGCGISEFLKDAFETNPTKDTLFSYNYYTHRDPFTNDMVLDAELFGVVKDLDLNANIVAKDITTDTICCIFLDWNKPEEFIDSIEKWLKFLLYSIDLSLKNKYTINDNSRTCFVESEVPEELKDYTKAYKDLSYAKDQLTKTLQSFKASQDRNWDLDSDNKLDIIPLNEGALSVNLGLHIIFVLSRTEKYQKTIDQLELTASKTEFILQAIRKISLTLGAGLFALNFNIKSTIEHLRDYILFRFSPSLFTYTVPVEGIVIEQLAIPSGWDSLSKIKALTAATNIDESFLIQMEFTDKHHVKVSSKSHFNKLFPSKKIDNNVLVIHVGRR